ncbi:MAG TPA: adenylate/guanylate cyclase domain-containing protein [Usitatibacter sp.]|nr:adenylate/guanylate cyclase domain-containing protein [Usitatibacter sp.]
MKDPLVHDALRRIHDIVAEETGRALTSTARSRVEQVLHGTLERKAAPPGEPARLDRDMTILLADVRGFSSISASYPGATVLALLNRCFGEMSEIIVRHEGAIDKFIGDAIMATFDSSPDGDGGALRAVACAVDMQLAMEALNAENRGQGLPEMHFGIGINTGRVISARVGSELYSEHTVIGDEVNLASRIESFSLRGQVLISESTWLRCGGLVQAGDPMDAFVKGRSKLVPLREVLGIASLGKSVPRHEMRRSMRVPVKLPLSYRMVADRVVIPEAREGTILDISYHGVLAEVPLAHSAFSEMMLDFDLPLVGARMTDLIGRVVNVSSRGDRAHVGVEFTSMRPEQKAAIQLFVQLLIQGTEARD